LANAQLVTGPVGVDQLGFVLMHEHILMRDHNVVANYPHLIHRERELAEAVERLKGLKERGIGTVVDLTTVDLGRDIHFIEDAARGSGMQVIAATGMWWSPPGYFALRSIDVLVECFERDIKVGIADTAVRAGVIKMAVHTDGVTPAIEMALRAGARTNRSTGVPIATHTDAHHHRGDDQQAIFLEEGVDLSRTVIGHSGDTTDLEYLKRLMERGSYIGMDRFGLDYAGPDKLASFDERVATVAELCKAGYTERMVLSHDASCCWEIVPEGSTVLSENPDWSVYFISDKVLPAMLKAGISQAQIDTMGRANPRRLFSNQEPY